MKKITEMKKRPYTDVLLPYLTRQKCARSTDFVNVICQLNFTKSPFIVEKCDKNHIFWR